MTDEESIQELQDLIQRVVEAETNDFSELAEISGLDIAEDFAGADLSNADLSVSLSGALALRFVGLGGALSLALRVVRLGGALTYGLTNGLTDGLIGDLSVDLSDALRRRAKLSNANLRFADLRRADLSNADLSNADLSNADLRRADLSNADLSNADLSNANLSNADLSGAEVENARFGYNSGISEDMRLYLIRRGAIF